jgi:glycine C-acetyltransferase
MMGFESFEEELEQLKQEGRFRPLTIWDSEADVWMQLQGRRILQLSSNNYLGLAQHPKLKKAAIEAINTYGVGSGSVRTITGTLRIHDQLEMELAKFKGTEAALVFQSGFIANQAILSSLLGPNDVVISDELNHASIIDGLRLTKSAKKIYAHKDMTQLEDNLRKSQSYRHRWIVTDGVFSMDGDIAPLPQIVELAEKYNAFVYVDDAHASGVLGKNGKGSVDHFSLQGRVHVQMGTLSKALGAVGGYFAGSQVLKDYLIHKARPFLFSTAQPPSVAATCIAAIQVLTESPELVQQLWVNAAYFRNQLISMGLDTSQSETPIIPLIIGEPETTIRFSQLLGEKGVYAQGIVFPMVAWDKGRIRFIVTAMHTREDLDLALTCIQSACKEFGLLK